MNYFFIFALPRSRTSWLANYFTAGPAFCLHDGLQYCEQAADLRDVLDVAAAVDPTITHVGDSDSGLCMFPRQILEHFPGSRALFVRREWEFAAVDFIKFNFEEPFAGQARPSNKEIREQFKRMDAALEEAIRIWPAGLGLDLDVNALDNPSNLQAITAHLVPDMVHNPFRYKMLNALRINPIPAKIPVDWERTRRLMATADQSEPSTINSPTLH